MYYVVDYRQDGRVDYVRSFPDSRNGQWFNAPETTGDPDHILRIESRRTAQRVANLLPGSIVRELWPPPAL